MLSIQGNLQHKHICNKVISEIDILCFIVLAAGSKKLGSIRPHDIFEYRWIITRHRCTTVATDGEAFISNAFVEHDDPLIWPNRHSGVGISLNSYNIVSIRQCGIKGLLRCGMVSRKMRFHFAEIGSLSPHSIIFRILVENFEYFVTPYPT